MFESFLALSRVTGIGPGGIAAEVLKAGGCVTVVLYGEVATDGWPLAWRGGRLVTLRKRKGARHEADENRGVVLDDGCRPYKTDYQSVPPHMYPSN